MSLLNIEDATDKELAAAYLLAISRGIPESRNLIVSAASDAVQLSRKTEGTLALAAMIACAMRDPEKAIVAALVGVLVNYEGEEGAGETPLDKAQRWVFEKLVQVDDWVSNDPSGINTDKDALSNSDVLQGALELAKFFNKIETGMEMASNLETQFESLVDGLLNDTSGAGSLAPLAALL